MNTGMPHWKPHVFAEKKPFLAVRRALRAVVREYFENQGFWEVETPILQACPTFETHIHAFETTLLGVDLQPQGPRYLHTSPEYAMKKFLVAGVEAMYQLCPVYRNGEGSRLHSPEFTMLEWYRAHTDYHAMMEDCETLLKVCAEKLELPHLRFAGRACDPSRPFERLSVRAAFARYAKMELNIFLEDVEGFRAALIAQNIRMAEGDAWDDLFFRVMAEKIEPYLGMETPCILHDYPAGLAPLSRRCASDPRYAERFEVYVCGVELANASSELCDPLEQRRQYEAQMVEKSRLYGARYPLEEDFMAALEYGMPPSSGCALGFDRLVMLATNAERIDQVLWSGSSL